MSLKAFCLLVFYCILLASVRAQVTSAVFATAANYQRFEGKELEGIEIERRSIETIYKTGGSDFAITAENRFHKRFLKRGAFLVQSGESLYVNCYLFGKGLWYSRAQRLDEQLIFLAPDLDLKRQRKTVVVLPNGKKVKNSALSRGAAALKRHYYTYNLSTGGFNRLDKAGMLRLLQTYPTLAERYRNEVKPEALRTYTLYIIDYLRRQDLNEVPAGEPKLNTATAALSTSER